MTEDLCRQQRNCRASVSVPAALPAQVAEAQCACPSSQTGVVNDSWSCRGSLQFATQTPLKDVQVVEATPLVSFRATEHGDIDPDLGADPASASLPRTVFQRLGVLGCTVLAAVAQLVVFTKDTQNSGRLDLASIEAMQRGQTPLFE